MCGCTVAGAGGNGAGDAIGMVMKESAEPASQRGMRAATSRYAPGEPLRELSLAGSDSE